MKTTTILLLAACLVCRHAGAATADAAATPDTRYRIDVRAGALPVGTEGHGAGPALGLGAGYALTEHVDLTASGDVAAHGAALFGDSESFRSITAGARLYPLGRHTVVRPWLGAEGGWYGVRHVEDSLYFSHYYTPHVESRVRDSNGGGINFGSGVDVPLGRHVSIGTDVRYHQTLGVFDDPGFLTTMANVSFHFGH